MTTVKRVMKGFCPKNKKSKLNFEIDIEEVPTKDIQSILDEDNLKSNIYHNNSKVINYRKGEPLFQITIFYDKQKEIEKLEQELSLIQEELRRLKNEEYIPG